MSDPGLSHRLRQRSRRAGFMIGLSMILTIALCAVGFTVIYTALDGFTTDFVSSQDNDAEVTPTDVSQIAEGIVTSASGEQDSETAPESNEQQAEGDNESDSAPTQPDASNTDDDDSNGFEPDYQVGSVTVNLREGPSTSTGIVNGLPPATPLQYLDEDAPTESSADGDRWMRFVTEDGLEGWIREIDVTEYEP